LTEFPKFKVVKFEQSSKAVHAWGIPISSQFVALKFTFVIFVQFLNVAELIVVMPLPIVTTLRFVQSINAP